MKPKMTFTRLAGAGLFAAVLALAVVQVAQAEPDWRAKQRSSGFNLRASSTWNMSTNRVSCGLDNQGNVCTDVTGSPTGGGGFWPGGPPMQYIFNSGLQIAGIIPEDAPIWAGDTVGAYFFDARGTQPQGQQITLIYSSANPEDVADWPNGAYVRDAGLYDAALLGRKSVSQEDTWMRYWDGPSLLSGRLHPMGIMVEQRGLAWNYPSGNEDILYFIYTFTNITSSDPSAYAGIDAAVRDEIAQLGADWVAATEDRLGVNLPSSGYRIDSLFAAFAMDPDVGNASVNASTAILPFSMGVAFKSDFNEPTWLYPPEVNGAPFGPYPGFIGVKYLKSPVDAATGEEVGLTLFSNTTNGGQFPDPRGVVQLWRYLSGRISLAEGDPTCTINPPIERRLCSLVQDPSDTRFYQSSGPLSLGPGEQGTIVVAYVHAAPIAAQVLPFYQGTLYPGIPPSGADLFAGTDTLRVIERAAGWISAADDDNDGQFDQDEVVSVNRSLLQKAMVAQSLFDAKFLLPFAPEPPDFYLVPGDNSVTVVWQPSPTETLGDPYFGIASDPANALADANYREFDVEGYRIWRGRTRSNMQMVVQFDYAGTTFDDYVGLWAYTGRCAPELGILDDCPADFPLTPGVDDPVTHDLVDAPYVPIEMIKPGGRVELADGSIFVTETFNPVRDAGFPDLANTGVPFAWVDNTVVNSTGYFYAVTAFDVNSIASGPGTLESPLATQSVYPRAPAPNLTTADVEVGLYGRGERLNSEATFSFSGQTGRFTGPPPPTGSLQAMVDVFAPTLLQAGTTLEMRVDSLQPTYYGGAYYLTVLVDGQTVSSHVIGDRTHSNSLRGGSMGSTAHDEFLQIPRSFPADAAAATAAGLTGLPGAAAGTVDITIGQPVYYSGDAEWHDQVDGSFWSPAEGLQGLGGSRWFDGTDETMDNPTGDATTVLRGQLTGVTTISSPQPYVNANAIFRRNRQSTWFAARQADVKFYWGSTPGTLDSVIDVTHNVPIEFGAADTIQVGWGFRDDISGTSTTYNAADGIITEYDFGHGPCYVARSSWSSPGCATRPFLQQAVLQPVDIDGDLVADGDGFALYFAHEFYIFLTDQLPSNTVWTHRSYFGNVTGSAGAYAFRPTLALPAVPGVSAKVMINAPAAMRELVAEDLDNVHTVPDPYYVTSGLEVTPTQKVIKFVNLPPQAMIRIYSLSGVLVDVLEHNDPGLGGEETWNVRNRNQQFVASGVYFYHVETPAGLEKIGRFTVVNASGLAVGAGIQ